MRSTKPSPAAVVARLTLPDPWEVETLVAMVATTRQRAIELCVRPAADDGITGTVMATKRADYIFVRDDLKGLHRDHAVCHELGHLLAGHTDDSCDSDTSLLTVVHGSHVSFNRSCDYGEPRESEAEQIADRIMKRVARCSRQRSSDPTTARIARGFGDALR